MFSLHETTKIHLCRAAFVLFCLTPTCAVLAWSVVVHLPEYRQFQERAISAQLGLQARLAKASSPRPGVMLYEGLELSDPDTRQLLARLPFVEVRTVGAAISIVLAYPAVVNGQRLEAFWKLAHEQTQPSQSWRQLRLEAQNLTLQLPEGDESFTDLQCRVENNEQQSRYDFVFHRALAGMQPTESATLIVVRNRQQPKPPTNVFQFTTGPTPLPCSLATFLWPEVECLGRAGEFQGKIFATDQSGTWKTQLSGRASKLDLDLLVSQRFPHKLTGLADVQLELVTIQGGRIEMAAGKIAAGPGLISRSLLQSAQEHLHLRAEPDAIAEDENLVRYHQLGLAFEIHPRGLSITGDLPRAKKGALLVLEDQQVLLREPSTNVQAVVNLARALVPQSEVQVPATRETDRFTRALPVPSIVQPPGEGTPATARSLRLKPNRK